MQSTHALNIVDSFCTLLGMESLNRSGATAPTASPRSSSARGTSLQQIAIDSVQRCQQQSQQQ
jgi:hypothetical protein